MSTPIWLTEQDVVSLITLPEAIPALEQALKEEHCGAAANMSKTLLQYGKANLHAIGAKVGRLVGTKTWVHTEGGTCPLLTLWDATDGRLVAVIEAFALGSMRTAGISGVATSWMARPEARSLAIVGTGKQALPQAAAVLAVRPIDQIRVFSPRPEARQAFVKRIRDELGVEALECASVEASCDGADIVTLVTRASAPILKSAMLKPGVHLNAVGAIAPDREEFDQDVFGRVDLLAVDDPGAVRKLSREFMTRFGEGDWSAVRPLSALIAAGQRRSATQDVSLFKAMGMGISDLALGSELVRRAHGAGVGRPIPQPVKAKPQLVARKPSATTT